MVTRLDDVPPELVVDFDMFDESIVDTVHERLAEIQQRTPLAYCPHHGGYWFVTRYDDVYEVLKNDDIYSAAETGLGLGVELPRLPPLHFDAPEHTAYRTMMNPVFSPARMFAVESDIRAMTTKLLDAFVEDGTCEFISQFAHPLATTVFLSLMGWPLEDLDLMAGWTHGMMVTGEVSTEELLARRASINAEVQAYFEDMVEQRRGGADEDDITGFLMRALYDGERPLSDDELIRMMRLLMAGGLHTVRGIMGFGMISLSENPVERQRLIDDPSLIPTAVEELLRLGVGSAPARLVIKPVTLHGVEVQPGDHVVSFISAANRDPEVFDDPHTLRIDREHNRHLTFASGRHRCIGSNLARTELRVAFEELLARMPDFRVDPERPPLLHHGPIRGLQELHLTFTPTMARVEAGRT
jgi:cytochrome P450